MSTSSASARQDRDFAVVIGINDYPFIERGGLDSCHTDAKDVFDRLTGLAGVPKENMQLLLSTVGEPGARPEQEQVDAAFEAVFELAHKSGGGRRLYVYFAGHGLSTGPRHAALLTAACRMDTPNRSLNTEAYHHALSRRALFLEQVFFYDCCRAYDWQFRGAEPRWYIEKPGAGVADVQQWVYYAAGFNQIANAPKPPEYSTRRGLFTRALLEGLDGAAARPVNGGAAVTAKRLGAYVERRLDYLVKEARVGRQNLETNHVNVAQVGDLVLFAVETLPVIPIVIVAHPTCELIVVRDSQFRELLRLHPDSGRAETKLSEGLYILEIPPTTPEGRPQYCAMELDHESAPEFVLPPAG